MTTQDIELYRHILHDRDFRIRDVGKMLGLSAAQVVHAGRVRIGFGDFNTGRGNPRRLSLVEVFQLALLKAANGKAPADSYANLGEVGRRYLAGIFVMPETRREPATIIGYADAEGRWWWVLTVGDRRPERVPEPDTNSMIVIRPRPILGRILAQVADVYRDQIGADLESMRLDLEGAVAGDLAGAAATLRPAA